MGDICVLLKSSVTCCTVWHVGVIRNGFAFPYINGFYSHDTRDTMYTLQHCSQTLALRSSIVTATSTMSTWTMFAWFPRFRSPIQFSRNLLCIYGLPMVEINQCMEIQQISLAAFLLWRTLYIYLDHVLPLNLNDLCLFFANIACLVLTCNLKRHWDPVLCTRYSWSIFKSLIHIDGIHETWGQLRYLFWRGWQSMLAKRRMLHKPEASFDLIACIQKKKIQENSNETALSSQPSVYRQSSV